MHTIDTKRLQLKSVDLEIFMNVINNPVDVQSKRKFLSIDNLSDLEVHEIWSNLFLWKRKSGILNNPAERICAVLWRAF